MANFRNDRIQEELKREIDRVIRDDLDDPRLTGTYSITRVDVARDLSRAKVFVSVLEEEARPGVLKALKSAAGFIRRELTRNMAIRHVPDLQFAEDHNIAYGIRINELLKQVSTGGGSGKNNDERPEEQ
ncbi:MAG: 30S ribosome-binding factor RbfA [Clostridiales bacterium]|nr:30S ribosome-binding factor RbfA [Clostridiales bacterium]